MQNNESIGEQCNGLRNYCDLQIKKCNEYLPSRYSKPILQMAKEHGRTITRQFVIDVRTGRKYDKLVVDLLVELSITNEKAINGHIPRVIELKEITDQLIIVFNRRKNVETANDADELRNRIENLVNSYAQGKIAKHKISQNSKKPIDLQELERKIDQMVYELYGLTPEEIAVVEGKAE